MPVANRPLISLWAKRPYTAFMAVLIPIYLKNYGPTNFLYFCDVVAILTVVAIWLESPAAAIRSVDRGLFASDGMGRRFHG